MAYGIAQTLRFSFDLLAGFKTRKATEVCTIRTTTHPGQEFTRHYHHNQRNTGHYLNRVVFLETVAGIPGMVAGMLRHLNSLRRMKRDHGWMDPHASGGGVVVFVGVGAVIRYVGDRWMD